MTPSLFCFFVASVIGTRLHVPVALTCILMAFYLLFLRWWRMAKFFVFFMIYHQKINSLCWEWRKWETIFIWSAYYLCTYSECEGKGHCKYVLLCNLYCNYMNRCNNVALTIIIFGGKDRPLDKKKLGMELNLYIEAIVYTVIISIYLLLLYIFYAWRCCKSKAINRDNYF